MDSLVAFFGGMHPAVAAFIATTFTWFVTACGAALVFFFKELNRRVLDGMLGFTGGVMMAASFWSLLSPAIDMTSGSGFAKAIPASVGFVFGALFIYALDQLLPHLHVNFPVDRVEGVKTHWRRSTLLVLAITLHNIPEGLAVGVLFGGVAAGMPETSIAGALMLAIGIGLQNFPEGMAVSFPLRRAGLSRAKSFWFGQLSAIVEPIAGVIGALAVVQMQPVLPYALAFAAGAMIYVVIEEVVPETQLEKSTDVATLGFIAGFVLMMVLDVGLG
jgi:zinc transporter, ZIP family